MEHIDNMSRSFVTALETPVEKDFKETFNAGQIAHNDRIRDLDKIVVRVGTGSVIGRAKDASPHKRSTRVGITKFRRHPSAFQPQWDACVGAEPVDRECRASALPQEKAEELRNQRVNHSKKPLAEGILDADLCHVHTAAAVKVAATTPVVAVRR